MRVKIDQEKCVGAGLCVMTTSVVFDQDENTGLVVLRQENPTAEEYENVRIAVRSCPSGAISIEGETC